MFEYVVSEDYSKRKITRSYQNADLNIFIEKDPLKMTTVYVINYSREYKMTAVIFLKGRESFSKRRLIECKEFLSAHCNVPRP